MKTRQMAALLILMAGPLAAQPWIPNECQTRYTDQWNNFARSMQGAKPGSPIYAPKPYPKKDVEVIEDFKYGYRQMLKGQSRSEIDQDEWPLFSALERNTLAFRVIRVENWAPDRCRPDRQRDFNYVLYLTDTASGEEVARAFVSQAGLLSGWTLTPDESEANFAIYRSGVAPRLDEALLQVSNRFGIKGARAQYVTTWGNPQCPLPAPCVAFEAQGKTYLYRAGELVEFSTENRSYTRAEMEATRNRRFEISNSIRPEREWLVSVADNRWVVATRRKPIR